MYTPSFRTSFRPLVAAVLLASLLTGMATAQTPAGNTSAEALRAYPVPKESVQAVAGQLQRKYLNRSDVRVAADARGGQVLVVAPADVQAEIAQQLSQAPAAPAPAAALPRETSVERSTARVPLRKITPADMQRTLSGAYKKSADNRSFVVPLPEGNQGLLTIDEAAKVVQLDAPDAAIPVLRKLVQSLDVARSASNVADVVTLQHAEPASITRAMMLAGAPRPSVANSRQHIGQFVTMVFQPEAQQAEEEAQDAEGNQPAPGEAPANGNQPGAEEFGAIGDVRIEFIEGLDQIVVSGRRRDVERVLQIIEQIEQQSLETRPAVEIYYLRHVDGRALTDLINQIYSQVFAVRQGNVSITPLIKPNALLLIGREENLAPVIELIKQLDRPVPPDSQIKVFHLKYMAAADAEATVRNFFVDRPGVNTDLRQGLGTRVMALAEFRTNSLIVQAAPRDLLEVASLLKTLDVPAAASTDQVRVIRLRNTLAEELAPVVQNAISGQRTGQGTTLPGQQPQGAGAAGTGTNQTSPRSASVQLLQVDGNDSKAIESGILSDMKVTPDPRGNALIISGPAHGMALLEALIRQLDDLPAMEAQIKVFQIINGDATSLADMLRQLFGQPTQGNQAQLPGFGSASGENSLVPLRFTVDQRTNTIIASGSSGDLDVVYRILVRLDEGDIRNRLTTVYRLRNAPAIDVANALNQLLTSQRQVNQLAPNLTSPFEQIEREVIIVPEVVSNSLIVSATPRFFEDIRKVVEELDRRPPMVVIQVLLAEVALSDIDQFGIELGLQDSLLFDRGIGAIGFPFNQPGIGNNNTPASLATRENVAGQALSNFGVGRTDTNLGFGGLVLSASSESVSILIRALQQSQRLQILSRPQVQTLDNQPAYVQVGAQVPFITSSQLTTFGTVNSTEFQNVGVILGVTPRTSPDGMIVMEVDATKSQLGPIEQGIPISINQNGDVIRSPQIEITRAQTTVSARSGQTVILGGLITKNQNELTRRVPYLGDIPVLGRLFRFDSVTSERRELLIILTPYIMTTEEQIAWMNQRESERMNWCLADVVNVHGETPLDSSGKFDFVGPTMYPESPSAWPPAERLEPNPPINIPMDNPLSPASNPNPPASDVDPLYVPAQPLGPTPAPAPAPTPADPRFQPPPSVPLKGTPQFGPAFGPRGAQNQAPQPTPARPVPPPDQEPARELVRPLPGPQPGPQPVPIQPVVAPAGYQLPADPQYPQQQPQQPQQPQQFQFQQQPVYR